MIDAQPHYCDQLFLTGLKQFFAFGEEQQPYSILLTTSFPFDDWEPILPEMLEKFSKGEMMIKRNQ